MTSGRCAFEQCATTVAVVGSVASFRSLDKVAKRIVGCNDWPVGYLGKTSVLCATEQGTIRTAAAVPGGGNGAGLCSRGGTAPSPGPPGW